MRETETRVRAGSVLKNPKRGGRHGRDGFKHERKNILKNNKILGGTMRGVASLKKVGKERDAIGVDLGTNCFKKMGIGQLRGEDWVCNIPDPSTDCGGEGKVVGHAATKKNKSGVSIIARNRRQHRGRGNTTAGGKARSKKTREGGDTVVPKKNRGKGKQSSADYEPQRRERKKESLRKEGGTRQPRSGLGGTDPSPKEDPQTNRILTSWRSKPLSQRGFRGTTENRFNI